ncbi:hypothetical protein COB55_02035 [Candidatus Wolfebacteria bacterium]|nr:MAG: hypothetical protein COB55_02035 [Candidatus Wolfebacteria bacterium]
MISLIPSGCFNTSNVTGIKWMNGDFIEIEGGDFSQNTGRIGPNMSGFKRHDLVGSLSNLCGDVTGSWGDVPEGVSLNLTGYEDDVSMLTCQGEVDRAVFEKKKFSCEEDFAQRVA